MGECVPSQRINNPHVEVVAYDVIGMDGDQAGFIRHAGLASSSATHDRESVAVTDMAPPLRVPGYMKADAIGTAELTEDEARKIKDFLDRHEGEHQSVQNLNPRKFPQVYCIAPHAAPLYEADGRYARMRFSCAGFVFEAYKRASIQLLDEDRLPAIGLDQIKQAYADVAAILDRPVFRESMGLAGSGPWPVMLCGYLFHSLARDAAAIRARSFIAVAGDDLFL
jgi:hypothetical protein